MSIVKAEVFLEKYREFEKAIRDNMQSDSDQSSVMFYEEQMKATDSVLVEKLRYLRTMRNIATHNPGLQSFIAVTDSHIKFLDEQIRYVSSINGTVKDSYQTFAKSGLLGIENTIADVCDMFTKKKTDILPLIITKKNVNTLIFVTYADIINAMSDPTVTKKTKLSKLTFKNMFESPEATHSVDILEPLSKVKPHDFPLAVIKSGKIVGILR